MDAAANIDPCHEMLGEDDVGDDDVMCPVRSIMSGFIANFKLAQTAGLGLARYNLQGCANHKVILQ